MSKAGQLIELQRIYATEATIWLLSQTIQPVSLRWLRGRLGLAGSVFNNMMQDEAFKIKIGSLLLEHNKRFVAKTHTNTQVPPGTWVIPRRDYRLEEFGTAVTHLKKFSRFLSMVNEGITNRSSLARRLRLSRMTVHKYVRILISLEECSE